jgi:hypothetical protein
VFLACIDWLEENSLFVRLAAMVLLNREEESFISFLDEDENDFYDVMFLNLRMQMMILS